MIDNWLLSSEQLGRNSNLNLNVLFSTDDVGIYNCHVIPVKMYAN